MSQIDVGIIGAGLSGLTAAIHLQEAGLNVKVYEAADEVGGRVRTDKMEGFLLDRGFQVLLTAYPECRALLDYDKLDLKPFFPGSRIRYNGNFELFADPRRTKGMFFKSLRARNATLRDKIKIFFLSNRLRRTELNKLWERQEMPTYMYLRKKGFSDKVLTSFFQPFLGGVFLEKGLNTSSRFFEFVFKMFAEGDIAVPAKGMGEIPKQLAAQLSEGTVQVNAEVVDLNERLLNVNRGELVECGDVLIATDGSAMKKLMNSADNTSYNETTCLYFSADNAPETEAILMLNGEQHGWVNNVVVMSNVSNAYAPDGKSLVSVSLVKTPDEADLEGLVKNELVNWFGDEVNSWKLLKMYHIPKALPAKETVSMKQGAKKLRDNLYACGDYLLNGSINAAMQSGREAAELIIADRTAGSN